MNVDNPFLPQPTATVKCPVSLRGAILLAASQLGTSGASFPHCLPRIFHHSCPSSPHRLRLSLASSTQDPRHPCSDNSPAPPPPAKVLSYTWTTAFLSTYFTALHPLGAHLPVHLHVQPLVLPTSPDTDGCLPPLS